MKDDSLDIGDFWALTDVAGLPRWYTSEYIKRDVIDDAIVSYRGHGRVRPVALAMLLLVDEVAVLEVKHVLTPDEAAAVLEDVRPQLDGLWKRALSTDVGVRVEVPRTESRIELAFLHNAAVCWKAWQSTAPAKHVAPRSK